MCRWPKRNRKMNTELKLGSAQLERAQAIIKDILVNHLPRVKEGLEKGYIDENQILVIYDHAVRARILTEHAPNARISGPANED